jgi:hypothetical protein
LVKKMKERYGFLISYAGVYVNDGETKLPPFALTRVTVQVLTGKVSNAETSKGTAVNSPVTGSNIPFGIVSESTMLPPASLIIQDVMLIATPPVFCAYTTGAVGSGLTPCTAAFSCPVVPPPVIVAIVPEVNMYTTMPAITAMAMRIRTANIGESALAFLRSLVIIIFLSHLLFYLNISFFHFLGLLINYVI